MLSLNKPDSSISNLMLTKELTSRMKPLTANPFQASLFSQKREELGIAKKVDLIFPQKAQEETFSLTNQL